jgi:glyoxylase-like metal-dependent hydrolase (beta-lactamase superfamily II)
VAADVHRWEVDLGGRPLAGYVVAAPRPLVIDTGVAGTPSAVILPLLDDLGIDPVTARYVITHADSDHFGGNDELRQAVPGAAIFGPRDDQALIEDPDRLIAERYRQFEAEHGIGYGAQELEATRATMGGPQALTGTLCGGERLELGDGRTAEIVSAPGHTAGHICVWLADSRTMIVQDAVLSEGVRTYGGALVQPPPYLDRQAYVTTIARLRRYQPARLLTAHFPPAEGASVCEFLDRSEAWVRHFDEALSATMAEAGSVFAARDLLAGLDARLGPYPLRGDFIYAIGAHMTERLASGSVTVQRTGSPMLWKLSHPSR